MVQDGLHKPDGDTQSLNKRSSSAPTCIISSNTENLLRFVDIGDGNFHYDPFGKLEGSSFFISTDLEILKQHFDANGFGPKPAFTFEELTQRLLDVTVDKIYQNIAFCKKTGKLVSGFMKVKSALETTGLQLVLVATDAKASDIQKIEASLRGTPLYFFGSQSDFSRILNKENAVYLGFKPSELTNKIKTGLKSLENLRINENRAI